MDGLTWNKLIASILCSLLVIKIGDVLSARLVHPAVIDKPGYIIEAQEEPSGKGESKAEGPGDIKSLTPNVENGEKIFKKCMQCHTINKGGMHKIGPNLWDVENHKHDGDFAYSSAMKAFMEKEKWTMDNLNKFLYKPSKLIPGTKMSFVGLKNDQERADVIAYVHQQADNPKPLA